jgi:hypothetical protein
MRQGPNENKMSDGGRERALPEVRMWKSSQNWSEQRSAVRSIAWLDARITITLRARVAVCQALAPTCRLGTLESAFGKFAWGMVSHSERAATEE